MKTALILGISGGFGGHVAQQLMQDGWKIKTLMRDPNKLAAAFDTVEAAAGDAADASAIESAAVGVDVIVYGINPRYNQWEQQSLPMLEAMLQVAEKKQLQVVFPGNVYAYQPDSSRDISEITATHPLTKKGEIRLAMEQRLRQASNKGVKVLIIRCGDFIGKDAHSTWMYRLIKPTSKGYQLSATGPRHIPHTWAYLPDVAKTVSELLKKGQLGKFEVFHFSGHRVSFNDIAKAIEARTGKSVKIVNFPWLLLQIFAPFSSMIRSVLEMRYLWNKPLNLSEQRLKKVLGEKIPHTDLEQALENADLLGA